jgi:hypothetical protein
MNRVELALLLRAVGLVCAIGALVVGHQGHRYWDDGSLAAFVLVLTIPAALGVAAAFALERPGLDRLSLPVGSLLAGLFLFVPVSIAAAGGDVNASEALGLCVSLVPLSLLVARPARRARAAVAAGLLPTIGSVLLLVAIWPDAISAGSRGYRCSCWRSWVSVRLRSSCTAAASRQGALSRSPRSAAGTASTSRSSVRSASTF